MSTHEEQVAMWHRLRNDPDFHPSWLKAMGQMPPTLATLRSWGDGKTSVKVHVIEDISFEAGEVWCRCGTMVLRTSELTLEDAWDVHRGRTDLVTQRVLSPAMHDVADDADVASFLTRVGSPGYSFEVTS